MTYTEEVVAQRDDLKNGEMRQVIVGETDVLLVRHDDQFYALHAYCNHYGAPLADGALSDGRIVCPWHHACYDSRTGDQLEPPGLDALETYYVELEGEDVVVRVPDEPAGRRLPEMNGRDEGDSRLFVILGGGAAGEYAAEALRANGFGGRVVMITRESETPYDRPNCSKEYLMGEAPDEWMFLRDEDFYDAYDIEVMRDTTVDDVDVEAKILRFADGEELSFDGIVICTGAIPRSLSVPGSDLEGVYTLRSLADSTAIMDAGRSSTHAVVVGASFIGMEVAYSLVELGAEEVTVVAPEKVPFAHVFGDRVGNMVKEIHEEHGVRFRLGRTVSEFQGEMGVERVLLDDGSTLEADLVVIGIGVRPATDFIRGVTKLDDGGIFVDDTLKAADAAYAAGDVAHFPDWRTGSSIRIEHWRLACQHGRLAGANLATSDRPNTATPYRGVPFFWTVHFGTSIRYVGHAESWDEIIYHGSPEDHEFIAFYVQGDRVLAAAGVNRDTEMAAVEEMLRRECMPTIIDLKRGELNHTANLKGEANL